jgi:hypothetical protein
MSDVTLNGVGCAAASVLLPRVGVWTADVAVDSVAAPSGAATLQLDTLSLRGTVLRGGAFEGSGREARRFRSKRHCV